MPPLVSSMTLHDMRAQGGGEGGGLASSVVLGERGCDRRPGEDPQKGSITGSDTLTTCFIGARRSRQPRGHTRTLLSRVHGAARPTAWTEATSSQASPDIAVAGGSDWPVMSWGQRMPRLSPLSPSPPAPAAPRATDVTIGAACPSTGSRSGRGASGTATFGSRPAGPPCSCATGSRIASGSAMAAEQQIVAAGWGEKIKPQRSSRGRLRPSSRRARSRRVYPRGQHAICSREGFAAEGGNRLVIRDREETSTAERSPRAVGRRGPSRPSPVLN